MSDNSIIVDTVVELWPGMAEAWKQGARQLALESRAGNPIPTVDATSVEEECEEDQYYILATCPDGTPIRVCVPDEMWYSRRRV